MKAGGGKSKEAIKSRVPVDYSQRDRVTEKIMVKENKEHQFWKDRLRKEKSGFSK